MPLNYTPLAPDPGICPLPTRRWPPIQAYAPSLHQGQRGEKWEKVGNWTQGEKKGRVSGVLSASLPLLAQEDP
eukprot:1195914-Prorocentrum_minimum.AAC.5